MKCLNVSSALKAFPLSTDGFQYWERNMFYCFLPKTARDSGINSHLSNLAIYQTYFSQYIWNIRKYTDWSLLSFDHLSLLKKLVFIFSCLIADRKIELPSAWLKLEEMKSLDVSLFFFLSFFLSFFFFLLYVFSSTSIHDSQDSSGRGRLSLQLLSTMSIHFTDT